MNLHAVDWTILAVLAAALVSVSCLTRRYVRSVSDFLAANRCAGRYLMCISDGAAATGAISLVAVFEQYYVAGFGAQWWTMMLMPISLILSLSGWVICRFRETRALTMAQFFEMRYSRKFRVFAGLLCWVSGVLNYGIFPAVTARFVVTICGFPSAFTLGSLTIPTLPVTMAVLLGTALLLVYAGGQVTVMVTDFLQGLLMLGVFLLVVVWFARMFEWSAVVATLKEAPEGQSLLNPFKQEKVKDFNLGFFIMAAVLLIYNFRAWQGKSGYNAAARTPHEARMAGILGEWRHGIILSLTVFVPVCAYVLFHSPAWSAQAADVRGQLAQIGEPQIRTQMTVPLVITRLLPPGLLGLFLMAVISAAITTDDTYLHSWGSILIQDVIAPLRKDPLSPRLHMWLLRLSTVGVAVLAFVFSLLFPLREYILMYMRITAAIFVGGAGVVIIGGLYWRRGTTAAAWVAMSVGSLLAVTGIALPAAWPHLPFLLRLAPKCPLNGMQLGFLTAAVCCLSYIVVSLLSRCPPFDIESMLHRNEPKAAAPVPSPRVRGFWKLIGTGDQFTRADRGIYLAKIIWSGFWITCFVTGTVLNLIASVSDDTWALWWRVQLIIWLSAGGITLVWFAIGGVCDLVQMFRLLATARRDDTDDGRVEHPQPGEQGLRADLARSATGASNTVADPFDCLGTSDAAD